MPRPHYEGLIHSVYFAARIRRTHGRVIATIPKAAKRSEEVSGTTGESLKTVPCGVPKLSFGPPPYVVPNKFPFRSISQSPSGF